MQRRLLPFGRARAALYDGRARQSTRDTARAGPASQQAIDRAATILRIISAVHGPTAHRGIKFPRNEQQRSRIAEIKPAARVMPAVCCRDKPRECGCGFRNT
jgi:hypothetical protein